MTANLTPSTTDDDWQASTEITDPEAIRMLTDLRALRFLMPFMTSAHTLSSAAAAIDKRPSTLAYWVPRMVRAGLLVHLGVTRRAGAPMPTYRAPARRLTVPYSAIPLERRIALLDQGRLRVLRLFLDGVDEALESGDRFSLGFSGRGERGTAITLVESPEQPQIRSYTDGWQTLKLDERDALSLARELETLIEKYADRAGASSYVLHVGLVRSPRFRWRSANDDLTD